MKYLKPSRCFAMWKSRLLPARTTFFSTAHSSGRAADGTKNINTFSCRISHTIVTVCHTHAEHHVINCSQLFVKAYTVTTRQSCQNINTEYNFYFYFFIFHNRFSHFGFLRWKCLLRLNSDSIHSHRRVILKNILTFACVLKEQPSPTFQCRRRVCFTVLSVPFVVPRLFLELDTSQCVSAATQLKRLKVLKTPLTFLLWHSAVKQARSDFMLSVTPMIAPEKKRVSIITWLYVMFLYWPSVDFLPGRPSPAE